MERNWTYEATVVKVVDGDTIDFNVDVGFHVGVAIRTRLLGIDTPELDSVEGKMVRDYLRDHLPPGTQVLIQTSKDKTDKYGRWLAIIHSDCMPPSENPYGAVTLNDILVQKGFANLYMV
jgi:micrococcal nuclease